MPETEFEPEGPTWEKPCDTCGHTVSRWRGTYSATCGHCGTEYNPGGQRLVSNWRGNPSSWDDDVSDLEGYEMQHAGDA